LLAKYASNSEPKWATILRLEQYFKVSHEAMLWRLLDVGYFRNRKQMEAYRAGVTRQAELLDYDTSLYRQTGRMRSYRIFPKKSISHLRKDS